MKSRLLPLFYFLFSIFFAASSVPTFAQAQKPLAVSRSLTDDLSEFVETPAVSGYEDELIGKIRMKLAAFHPTVDNLGNIVVTLGSCSPSRLIVTPIDEPGFIVSGITDDGYLR